jgi:hypothetical protein
LSVSWDLRRRRRFLGPSGSAFAFSADAKVARTSRIDRTDVSSSYLLSQKNVEKDGKGEKMLEKDRKVESTETNDEAKL